MPVQEYGVVLDIVKEASRQMSLTVPTGVYDSNDENVLLMGSNVNVIGPMLLAHRKCFQQFLGTFDLTGDGVASAFDIPADYSRLVNDTGWSSALRRPARLVSAQYWAAYRASLVTVSVQPIFRLMGDQFHFLNPPAAGEVISFEYVKRNWVIDGMAPTLLKSRANHNADTPMFDFLLMVIATKLKFREAKGFDTQAETADFNDRLMQLSDADVPGETLSLNGGVPLFPLVSGANLPPTNYGM